MSLSDTIGKLETLLSNLTHDLKKTLRGNRSAAQRVRVGTLRMEKIGKLFRKESVHAEKARNPRKSKKKSKKRKSRV